MKINIISEYRKQYIKSRMLELDPQAAHAEALHSVYVSLLHASNINKLPISDQDLLLLKDLNKNPHYVRLLEDIMTMPADHQRDYLAQCAKVPQLRLVK